MGCIDYSSKFYGMVERQRKRLPLDQFNQWLGDTFADAETILNAIENGDWGKDFTKEVIKERVTETPRKEYSDEGFFTLQNSDRSTLSFYGSETSEGRIAHNKMVNTFKKNIIKRLIYDYETKSSPNLSDDTNGVSAVNKILFNYKQELMRDIWKVLGVDYSEDYSGPRQFTKQLVKTLSAYEKSLHKKDVMRAYESYVILKNFDNLLKTHIDVVSIDKGYDNSPIVDRDMYEYKGPSMKRDASIGKESADANDYTGSIVKLLLDDYFPEVVNGQPDPTLKIGLVGFNRVMTHVIEWVEDSKNTKLISELNKGSKCDWDIILDAFEKDIRDKQGPYASILKSKLAGIRNYIFNKDANLPYDIINSFNRHVRDVYGQNYSEYVFSRSVSGGNAVHNAITNDYFVDVQLKNVLRIVQSKVDLFRSNTDEFEKFCERHNVEVKDNRITINQDGVKTHRDEPYTVKVVWDANMKRYQFNREIVRDDVDDVVMADFISDLFDTVVPDDYGDILNSINSNNLFDTFFTAIMTTIAAGSNKFDNFKYQWGQQLDTYAYSSDMQSAGKFFAQVYGGETINVVKNKEGNNLPLYSIGSAVRKIKRIIGDVKSALTNAYSSNIFVRKPEILKRVITRSQTDMRSSIKSSKDNSIPEIATVEVIHDFHENLYNNNGVIWMQPICYADKSTHTMFEIDTDSDTIKVDGNVIKIKDALIQIANGQRSEKLINAIEQRVFTERKSKLKHQVIESINRFTTVFDYKYSGWTDNFVNYKSTDEQIQESWNKIREQLKTIKSVKNLRAIFKAYNDKHEDTIDLIENYDFGTGVDGNLDVNLMFNDDLNVYVFATDNKEFKSRLNSARRLTAQDYWEQGLRVMGLDHASIKERFFTDSNKRWYDSTNYEVFPYRIYKPDYKTKTKSLITITSNSSDSKYFTDLNYLVELNPIFESHFLMKLLYGTPMKELMLGSTYAYNSKASFEGDPKNSKDIEKFNSDVRAAKIIEETKRALYCGATTTTYLQGLSYGVPKTANVACVSDLQGLVFNPKGDRDQTDVHDGSGWVSPYWAIQTNESLGDASVGWNKKTIYGHIDNKTGVFTEIKWAEFALSNQYRKNSPFNDEFSAERMFEKMHNKPIPNFRFNDIDLHDFYSTTSSVNSDKKPGILTHQKPVYYFNVDDGNYYEIVSISNEGKDVTVTKYRVNEKGVRIGESITNKEPIVINSLYDLDQLFGGAFCKERDSKTGYLVDSDANNYIVNNIICEKDLKDYMVHIVANKSAIKVGQKNLNSDTIFANGNNDVLQTFEISTKYGGVIMDADHEIEDSEVREMGQLVSALMQEGNSASEAKEIYTEIGEVVYENVKTYINASKNIDKTDLYNRLGDALLKAFATQDRDVIGLAQAFISKFEQGDQKYQIPFSSATIAPAFMSAVSSVLTKQGIRRTFPGVGAVQVPGRGVMMTYKFGDLNYDLEGAVKLASKQGVTLEQAKENIFSGVNYNDVKTIFAKYPELSAIGTVDEYVAYIRSIFPDSQVSDIYWHGSNSDFSKGFESAEKGQGSGSPHMTGEMYFNKQSWTSLQYIDGVNRQFGPDINNFNHWNKLWWELKEIMSNGRRENNKWKDLVIGPEHVRQSIPNKAGIFNRDKGGENGKWLKDRKADYGYENKTDEEFFRDIFNLEYGIDTFNTWTKKNADIFKSINLAETKGIYPVILNVQKPIIEEGKNTYYEPERGLITKARNEGFDSIISNKADNEFNSDVAVVMNPIESVYFLGTPQDIERFKNWKSAFGIQSINPFIEQINSDEIDFEDTLIIDGQLVKITDIKSYDYYRNIYKQPILRHNFQPRDLLAPVPKFSVNGKIYSIYDLDAVRKCNYIGSILSKKVKTSDEDVANFAQIFDNPEEFVSISKNKKELESLLQIYQKEADTVIKTISAIAKIGTGKLPMQKAFNLEGEEVTVDEVFATPGQIIMGKAYADKLGISKFDNIADIKVRGSRFFESQLRSALALPPESMKNKYDAVAYLNDGTKALIVIGDGISAADKLGETTIDTTFKEINGTIYKNNTEEICEASDIECRKYTSENGTEYSVFVIRSLDVLDKLNESKMIQMIRYNYRENNYKSLMLYNHDIEINEDGTFTQPLDVSYPIFDQITHTTTGEYGYITYDSVQNDLPRILRQDEIAKFVKKVETLANRKYDAFEKSLRFIGTRIPAQSMQSFMPLEVVCFTNSELNDVYVPHTLTWVAGSDYDIDKLYMMGYSLTNSGELFTYSNLADYYNIDDVLKLPEARGRKFRQSTETSTNHITYDELTSFINDRNLSPISKILKNQTDDTKVSFEQGDLNDKTFGIWKRRFIKTLNTHERTRLNPNSRTSALKNRIVSQIETLMLDPINIINMLNPISMDNAKDAASKTSLGNREKLMNYDVPTSMMIMQYQNMLGKNVIGSAASGLKAYFGELTYFNDIVENIYRQILNNDSPQNIYNNIKRIVFDGKYNSSDIRILGNTPLQKIIDLIQLKSKYKTLVLDDISYNSKMQSHLKDYIEGQSLNFEKLLQKLQETAWQYNTAQNISEVLSAATDNAKELILAKINATLEFSDIYTYLITTGVSIPEIAEFMTSPVFNIVSKFAKSDIFATTDGFHNLESTIKFVLDEKPLYILSGLDRTFKAFLSKYNKSHKKDTDIYHLLRTNKDSRIELVKYLAEICKKEKAKLGKGYNQYGEFNEEFEMPVDSIDPENIAPVKPKTTYHEYLAIYNYVTRHLIPKNEMLDSLDYNSAKKSLRTLQDEILPGVEEQKALASFFSINKGIQTKDWDEYNWIEKQNKNINSMYDRRSKDGVKLLENPIKFDFVRFTQDENYRKVQIDQFEKIKTTFNVLDIITSVNHFWEMLKTVGLNRNLIETSAFFRFERKLEKELLGKTETLSKADTKSIPQKDWRILSNYTRDVITLNWFMRQPDLTISIPEDWKYYNPNKSNIRKPDTFVAKEVDERYQIKLNTQEGIATFKLVVENYIIPTLKSDPDFKNNMFIQHLRRDAVADTESQEFIRKYAFPFSLTNIEKGSIFEKLYESIVKSFNRDMYKDVGAKFGIGSWSLGDLFFVYNLIVNKEGMGKSSMTKIFEDSINYGNEVKTAESYYNYIKMLDSVGFNLNELRYNIDDLKMRLAESSSAYNYGVGTDKTDKKNPVILITKDLGGKIRIPILGRNLSDFTFNMWKFGSNGYETLPGLPGISITNFNKMYEPNLGNKEVLDTVVDLMVERIGAKSKAPIKVVTNADIQIMTGKGELQFATQESYSNTLNAKSFIYNGVVYINSDNTELESPIHELFHIVCAGLKFNRRKAVREMYYKLLNDIAGIKGEAAKYYDELGKAYSDKHGSDRKEEVLVRALSDKFKNEFTSNWSKLISDNVDEMGNRIDSLYSHQLKQAIIDTLNETLGTSISDDIKEDDLGNYKLNQALVLFKSKLFELDGDWLTKTSITHNQTIATIKDRLVKTGDLKIGENC